MHRLSIVWEGKLDDETEQLFQHNQDELIEFVLGEVENGTIRTEIIDLAVSTNAFCRPMPVLTESAQSYTK